MKRLTPYIIVIALAAITACKQATVFNPSDKDTVPQSQFAPLLNDSTCAVDLQNVTGVAFPKYKILKETTIVPDSISIAASEETIASGNFSAILAMDTIAPKEFFYKIDTLARRDTCWTIKDGTYSYKRKDKTFSYTLSLSPKGKTIQYTQLRNDFK